MPVADTTMRYPYEPTLQSGKWWDAAASHAIPSSSDRVGAHAEGYNNDNARHLSLADRLRDPLVVSIVSIAAFVMIVVSTTFEIASYFKPSETPIVIVMPGNIEPRGLAPQSERKNNPPETSPGERVLTLKRLHIKRLSTGHPAVVTSAPARPKSEPALTEKDSNANPEDAPAYRIARDATVYDYVQLSIGPYEDWQAAINFSRPFMLYKGAFIAVYWCEGTKPSDFCRFSPEVGVIAAIRREDIDFSS
jgi:hypothetical protein